PNCKRSRRLRAGLTQTSRPGPCGPTTCLTSCGSCGNVAFPALYNSSARNYFVFPGKPEPLKDGCVFPDQSPINSNRAQIFRGKSKSGRSSNGHFQLLGWGNLMLEVAT